MYRPSNFLLLFILSVVTRKLMRYTMGYKRSELNPINIHYQNLYNTLSYRGDKANTIIPID